MSRLEYQVRYVPIKAVPYSAKEITDWRADATCKMWSRAELKFFIDVWDGNHYYQLGTHIWRKTWRLKEKK